jgi:hypothetical protein
MPRDPLIHIHQNPGEPCIACGDADTSDTDFMTNVGQWNSELRTCSPNTRLRPDFSISGRDDPRTSALKGERHPDYRKVRDPR